MTEADIIRSASSKWLRDNEAIARDYIIEKDVAGLKRDLEWSDWQVNNMLTYLALVDGDE